MDDIEEAADEQDHYGQAEGKIAVSCSVNAPLRHVWEQWTSPEAIQQWCHASDDWTVGAVSNDVRVGGRCSTTMKAKDDSVSFDFGGVYTVVDEPYELVYVMDDGREVTITFEQFGDEIEITETFDMEHENSAEKQREGWQAILNNFKDYVENN